MESQSVDHRWIDSGKFWSKPLFLFFTPFYGRLVSMFNHHDHVPVCITNWQKAYVLRYYTWWMVQFWSGKLLLSNRTFPIHLATLVYWRVSEPVAMSNGKPNLRRSSKPVWDVMMSYGVLCWLSKMFGSSHLSIIGAPQRISHMEICFCLWKKININRKDNTCWLLILSILSWKTCPAGFANI